MVKFFPLSSLFRNKLHFSFNSAITLVLLIMKSLTFDIKLFFIFISYFVQFLNRSYGRFVLVLLSCVVYRRRINVVRFIFNSEGSIERIFFRLSITDQNVVVVYQCSISNVMVTGDFEAFSPSKVHAVLEY